MARRALRPVRTWAREGALKLRPPRPPVGDPEHIAALSVVPEGQSFITGNGIAAHCRYVLNYDALTVNEGVENEWWFCKADYLEYFFRDVAPAGPFVLLTHNSDRAIDERFLRELRRPRLLAWFAQNLAVEHPKLRALPIGIANPRWIHGDQDALRRVQQAPPERSVLFDLSFDVATNAAERTVCLEVTGLGLGPRRPYPEYLRGLAASYFCIAPRGNGIDSHRVWEALYLRTVPVLTRSLVTEQHPSLPMIVLDDWTDFASIEFSPELYWGTLADWTPDEIRLDAYLERLRQTVAALAS